jgi:hypothetical protein
MPGHQVQGGGSDLFPPNLGLCFGGSHIVNVDSQCSAWFDQSQGLAKSLTRAMAPGKDATPSAVYDY